MRKIIRNIALLMCLASFVAKADPTNTPPAVVSYVTVSNDNLRQVWPPVEAWANTNGIVSTNNIVYKDTITKANAASALTIGGSPVGNAILSSDFSYDGTTLSLYVVPTISLSGGSARYKGQTVVNPVVTWVANKIMTTRSLSGIEVATLGSGGSGSYTNTITLDKDSATKTSTITVSDGVQSKSSTTTWSWTNLRYVGASLNETYLNSEIIAMPSGAQAKGASGTATGLNNEHIVIAYPTTLGYCSVFSIGGFTVASNSWPVVEQSVTNAYGFAESYLLYRSLNALTGSMSYDIH